MYDGKKYSLKVAETIHSIKNIQVYNFYILGKLFLSSIEAAW